MTSDAKKIEYLPTDGPAELWPEPGKSFVLFPAPLSPSGFFCPTKSVFGLARGLVKNLEKIQVWPGGGDESDESQMIHIDAKGSGEFDERDDEYEVVKFSNNRRSNLIASLMIMPAYFHAVTQGTYEEHWGHRGPVVNYDYYESSETVSTGLFYEWSVDPNHPYFSPYPIIDGDPEPINGKLDVYAVLDPALMPDSAYYLGMYRLHTTSPYHRVFNEGFYCLFCYTDDDDVASVIMQELRTFGPEGVPISVGSFVDGGDYLVYDDLHPGPNYSYAFSCEYGKKVQAERSTYRTNDVSPFESHAVSKEEFREGFTASESKHTYFEDSDLTWEVTFPDYYKWFSHVFNPSPHFSWSRDPEESHAFE